MLLLVIADMFSWQDGDLDTKFVPNFETSFESLEGAYEFYRAYAKIIGFSVKKNRTRMNGREFCCSFEGKNKTNIRMTARCRRLQNVMAPKQWCAQKQREMEGVPFLHALFFSITTRSFVHQA